HFTELRRSNHKPVAQPPSAAPPGPSARAATPGARGQPRQRNATSPTGSEKAPKSRTQLSPEPAPSAEASAPPPPQPSACQHRLTPDLALVRLLPSFSGPNSCGADDVVLLEPVVLEDRQRVELVPAATLRCPMPQPVGSWSPARVH